MRLHHLACKLCCVKLMKVRVIVCDEIGTTPKYHKMLIRSLFGSLQTIVSPVICVILSPPLALMQADFQVFEYFCGILWLWLRFRVISLILENDMSACLFFLVTFLDSPSYPSRFLCLILTWKCFVISEHMCCSTLTHFVFVSAAPCRSS